MNFEQEAINGAFEDGKKAGVRELLELVTAEIYLSFPTDRSFDRYRTALLQKISAVADKVK
jgi:hypothetical protein